MTQTMIDNLSTEEYSYYVAYGDDYENEYNAQESSGLNRILDDLLSDLPDYLDKS
jgi:hypothetical protein